MSSRMALPFLMVSVGCELVFIVDHRLREISTVSVPAAKKFEIIRETIHSVFNESLMDAVFQDQKLYSFEALRRVVTATMESPSLRVNSDNLEKLFLIVCMSIKCQTVRCLTKTHFLTYLENEINDVEAIAMNLPEHGDAEQLLDSIRDRVAAYYDHISTAEAARIRYSILNLFRLTQAPVSVLAQDGYQAGNGVLLAPAAGPGLVHLGHTVLYGPDGSPQQHFVLPIAGKNLEDREFELGRNRFSREAVQLRALKQDLMTSTTADDNPHNVARLSTQMSKVLSSRNMRVSTSGRSLGRYSSKGDDETDVTGAVAANAPRADLESANDFAELDRQVAAAGGDAIEQVEEEQKVGRKEIRPAQ
ncbi:Protein OSCP1 [Porphyridium purpureum]|uniref:Protein OSCP1 n=1 Tax=Porphyridium purpureum TaxID=35688 RepID=A0A5J4Z4I2_PORPP|nr:Protein OSCP1 [Porphyridium purpureum]|eukprot:POR1591..scf295_1